MRIFIKRYGYELSNITMHKYMNKGLNLCAVIMHSKPGYKTGKKNKIFDNLLNQNMVHRLHIYAPAKWKIQIQLFNY